MVWSTAYLTRGGALVYWLLYVPIMRIESYVLIKMAMSALTAAKYVALVLCVVLVLMTSAPVVKYEVTDH